MRQRCQLSEAKVEGLFRIYRVNRIMPSLVDRDTEKPGRRAIRPHDLAARIYRHKGGDRCAKQRGMDLQSQHQQSGRLRCKQAVLQQTGVHLDQSRRIEAKGQGFARDVEDTGQLPGDIQDRRGGTVHGLHGIEIVLAPKHRHWSPRLCG